MESEENMPERESHPEDFNPLEVLAEAEEASSTMVTSTEAPRSFMLALLVLITTILALFNVVSWPMIFLLCALLIPLGGWYYLLSRKRPKPRTVLHHSGPYVGYFLLLMLITQASRFWEAGTWAEVGAKWLVLFGVLGFCISRMRTAATRNRLKDANERRH